MSSTTEWHRRGSGHCLHGRHGLGHHPGAHALVIALCDQEGLGDFWGSGDERCNKDHSFLLPLPRPRAEAGLYGGFGTLAQMISGARQVWQASEALDTKLPAR